MNKIDNNILWNSYLKIESMVTYTIINQYSAILCTYSKDVASTSEVQSSYVWTGPRIFAFQVSLISASVPPTVEHKC